MSAPPVYGQQQQGYGPPQGQPQYQQGPAPQQGYGPPPPVQNGGQPLGDPSQQSEDASGFFDGSSGSPAISFGGKNKGFGDWHGGIFTGVISEKQSKNYDTKKPEFWDSGDPMLDVVVELLSPARDANNPLDDGRRRMFVPKRDTHIPDSMYSVVKEATRNGFHRGGQLWVCKAGQRRGEKSDRNVWQASYQPPTAETLAILDNLPPQGVSQQGAQSVQQQAGQQEQQTPFVAPQQQQQGPPQYQQVQGQPTHLQGAGVGYGQPAGQPVQGQPQQFPSYAGAPAASNQPQWGPNGGPQEQYAPAPQQQQGYGPPEQGPPGSAWNGQQQQQQQGYPQGPPPQQQGQQQQYQQGAPAQTANPYAQYQQYQQ